MITKHIFQKYFKIQKPLSNLFQAFTVDRPVDRYCFRPDRSTTRSTGPYGLGHTRLCTFAGRPGGRPTDPALYRLHDPNSQVLPVDRAGRPTVQYSVLKIAGGRPEPNSLPSGLPVDRTVNRQLSRLFQWLYFGSILFSSVSNGYFLFPSG